MYTISILLSSATVLYHIVEVSPSHSQIVIIHLFVCLSCTLDPLPPIQHDRYIICIRYVCDNETQSKMTFYMYTICILRTVLTNCSISHS